MHIRWVKLLLWILRVSELEYYHLLAPVVTYWTKLVPIVSLIVLELWEVAQKFALERGHALLWIHEIVISLLEDLIVIL